MPRKRVGLELLAKRQVAAFNESYHVGQRVRYWRGTRQGEGETTTTRTPAEALGGHTAVVFLNDVRGAVALTHVEAIPDEEEIVDAA